jgi:deoxyribonuclease-4
MKTQVSSGETLLIGSHTSTAGGYHRAAEIAGQLGMRTVQLFTKNNNQWKAKPISEEEAGRFLAAIERYTLVRPISHSSYLINLASPNPELWNKSVDSLAEEWRRAETLQLDGLVLHPGSATDHDEEGGLARIRRGILAAHEQAGPQRAHLLLENTAGQGSALGWKLEQLAAIYDGLERPAYLGLCLDSCHAHAAGYDLSQAEGLERLIDDFRRLGLLDVIEAIHLNDSKKGVGSRVDRHEHLGQGTLTPAGLARFINHPALRRLPMYLETEKGVNSDGEDWDAVNMRYALELFQPATAHR